MGARLQGPGPWRGGGEGPDGVAARWPGAVWRVAGGLAAAVTPALLVAVAGAVLVAAWPAVLRDGASFLSGAAWSLGDLRGGGAVVRHGLAAPPGAVYGVLPLLAGSALTSLLALVLALPVGTAVAVTLAEYARGALGGVLGFCVELLGAVPGVVFGLWALAVVVPWVERRAGPALARALAPLPFFRGPVLSGQGLLAASLVLAAMIVPIFAAAGRDALLRVPAAVREQGRALGLTDFETLRDLVLPLAGPGLAAGALLALGRAVGEAMAVVMVGGSTGLIPATLYSPTVTLASAVVMGQRAVGADPTGMAAHALAEVVLVLLAISVLVHLAVPVAAERASRAAATMRGGRDAA